MKLLKFALLCSLGVTAGQALACYTVYDRSNSVVYNAQTPPVDMSLPLHQALQQRFPGGHMVFGAGTDCPVAQPQTLPLVRNSPGTSPLLTDRASAQAMGLPHTMLAGNVALVAQRPDSMRPGVVVAQAEVDPAEAALRTMGGPPGARPATRRGTVITEMRNPPLTIVQDAYGNKVVTELR